MKRIIVTLTLFLFLSISFNAMAQQAPPPPPAHGAIGNNNTGGGAPIGSGLFVLLALSGVYGTIKLKNLKKEELED